ncbi:MAG: DUF1918 domain-containing protein [Pseudonocardiaceae bacterium]
MTARVGDEIMILPQELHEPVHVGQIREIRNDLGGVVYLVQWSDTGHESLLPHGPDVVIKHRHTPGGERNAPWRDRLRHSLERRHNRDLERRQQVGYERLAWRVEEIIAGLELTQSDFSIAAGRVFHVPEVILVDAGPPVSLDIRILPGQSPDDFSAHAAAIAYDLGMADVRVVPLGPSAIRLELLPHDRLPGPASR